MKLGVALRVMGPGSETGTLRACAQIADRAGIDDLWIQDHIAIPPDDAEGSNGRYLDPLATLGYLAAATERVHIGTAVLVLPYRPRLPTAKAIATIQTLSKGRLQLGVGVGWMQPEFTALGIPRAARGLLTDETLAFLNRCFGAEDDVVTENGQPFLFRPHPPKPPIYVGGHGAHALARVVAHADGWMPMSGDPAKLAPQIAELNALAERAGRSRPAVVAMGPLDLADPAAAGARLAELAELGVTRFMAAGRYAEPDEFAAHVDAVMAIPR
jgi:probable F420-dependent oxidoreductase